MKEPPLSPFPQPIQGKTFSLQQGVPNSDGYYQAIAAAADDCLGSTPDAASLLEHIQALSRDRRRLRGLMRKPASDSPDAALLHALHERLAFYTPGVAEHLKRLSLLQRFEDTLTTTEEQYHLYMLEIELANHMNMEAFRAAGQKVAFLPHCLRDQSARCRAAQNGLDLVCQGCSQVCGVNAVSRLLRAAGIEPYIWMEADLPGFFQGTKIGRTKTGRAGHGLHPGTGGRDAPLPKIRPGGRRHPPGCQPLRTLVRGISLEHRQPGHPGTVGKRGIDKFPYSVTICTYKVFYLYVQTMTNQIFERESGTPLYLQLRNYLLERIKQGVWSEGSHLPTEYELKEEFGLSRDTIRQALNELEQEGIIERRRGVGTIVSHQRIQPELMKLTSFSEDMLSRGLVPESKPWKWIL